MSDVKCKKGIRKGSDSLTHLRKLCEELNNRDEELKKNEQMFKIILEDSPISMIAWSVDKDLRFTKNIGNVSELIDIRNPSGMRGKTLYEFFDAKSEDYTPIKHHRAALTGETRVYTFEYQNQVFWVKCKPIYNTCGDIVGASGVAWNFSKIYDALKGLDDINALMSAKPLRKMILHQKVQQIITSFSELVVPATEADEIE